MKEIKITLAGVTINVSNVYECLALNWALSAHDFDTVCFGDATIKVLSKHKMQDGKDVTITVNHSEPITYTAKQIDTLINSINTGLSYNENDIKYLYYAGDNFRGYRQYTLYLDGIRCEFHLYEKMLDSKLIIKNGIYEFEYSVNSIGCNEDCDCVFKFKPDFTNRNNCPTLYPIVELFDDNEVDIIL